MSFLLTFNRFHTLSWSFHWWIWTSKCRLSNFQKQPQKCSSEKLFQKESVADVLQKRYFKNFGISTRKYLHWILFLIMLQACSFLKKKLQRRYFPVKSAKFLKTHFLQNTSVGDFCCSQGLENFSVKKRPVWVPYQ